MSGKIHQRYQITSHTHIKPNHTKILHTPMQYFQVGHYFPKCHFWSRNVWVKLWISINSDKFRGWIFLHSLHFIFWSQTHLGNFWPTSFVRSFSCYLRSSSKPIPRQIRWPWDLVTLTTWSIDTHIQKITPRWSVKNHFAMTMPICQFLDILPKPNLSMSNWAQTP